uniref:CUB domain-containing protein n=1 Tax=Ascaris lumbricoides TaxID=6252 RepID=A0A0M3ICX0_ASCLU
MVYFANSENISLVFTTDGVRTAAGFQGIVSTMDCGCQNVTINIIDEKDHWIETPAYGVAPTYCPRLNCLWEVRFAPNLTLDISSFSMGLRMGDVLSITDFSGDQIASYSITSNSASEKFMATVSTGYTAFHFTSIPLDYVETSAQIGGFRIRMHPNSIVYNRSESISLAGEDNVASVSAVITPGQAFVWYVQARINRTVTLYILGTLEGTGAVLDVFDGPTIESPLLPVSQFYNATISTHTANEIHSSSDKLTFRIIGSSRMPSSYQFFGLLSDIVDDSYAVHCSEPLVKGFANEVITNIMRPISSTAQGSSTMSANSITSNEPSSNPTCIIVFHGVAKSLQLRSGLALEVIGASTAVEVYKGTTLAKNALLASAPPYPAFIFGNDVTFTYPAIQPPDTIAIVSTVMLRDYTESPTNNETIGYLFSPDFLSDNDLGRIYQRYSLSIEEEPLNGFQIEVMSPINNCQILIEGDYDGTPTLYDELLSGAPSRNVCVTNMAVIYRSNGGVGKGMFLKYRKGVG